MYKSSCKYIQEIRCVQSLTDFTKSQPHDAYSAMTKGLTSCWSYMFTTTPTIRHLLQPVAEVIMIREKFLPALTGRPPPNDLEHCLFFLPARFWGMGIHTHRTLLTACMMLPWGVETLWCKLYTPMNTSTLMKVINHRLLKRLKFIARDRSMSIRPIMNWNANYLTRWDQSS